MAKRSRERKAKQRARREAYQPYAPRPIGLTVAQAEAKIGLTGRGVSEGVRREGLEEAIANAKRKFGYTMRGTLDAAIASGAVPMISVLKDGERTLVGWSDVLGNVVLV